MAYTKYEPIGFENGILETPGSVNLETGEITMPVYSGKAPINATNLNKMDEAIAYLYENGAASGDTLPYGTIVEYDGTEVPVGYEEVEIEESQLDLTNTACGSDINYPIYANKLRKQNKLVTLDFEGYATNFVAGYNLIGKIPTEYLPAKSGYYTDVLMYFSCVVAGMSRIITGKINSDGTIEVYQSAEDTNVGYIPTTSGFRIHETWFTD